MRRYMTAETIAVKAQTRAAHKAERIKALQIYMDRFAECPFCGSINLRVDINGEKTDWVRCNDCNCTGPQSDGEDDAIGKWNGRCIEGS
jgi:transcription elongation factor Elf1